MSRFQSVLINNAQQQCGLVTPEVTSLLLVMEGEMSRREIMRKLGLSDDQRACLLPATGLYDVGAGCVTPYADLLEFMND